MDPEGGVRVRAYGDVLTVYVAPTYSLKLAESAPLILGLRTMSLKLPTEFDLAYPIAEFVVYNQIVQVRLKRISVC